MNLKPCKNCGKVPSEFKRLKIRSTVTVAECPFCEHLQGPVYSIEPPPREPLPPLQEYPVEFIAAPMGPGMVPGDLITVPPRRRWSNSTRNE